MPGHISYLFAMDRKRHGRSERGREEGGESGGYVKDSFERLEDPYFDDDRLRLPQLVPARVGLAGETPTSFAAWTVALPVTLAEDVFGSGRRVSRLGEESARGGLLVAVFASSFVAAAVLGDGGSVSFACDQEGQGSEENCGGEMHGI